MRIERLTRMSARLLGVGVAISQLAGCGATPPDPQDPPAITSRIYPLSVQPRRVHDIGMFSDVNAASAPAGAPWAGSFSRVLFSRRILESSACRVFRASIFPATSRRTTRR